MLKSDTNDILGTSALIQNRNAKINNNTYENKKNSDYVSDVDEEEPIPLF